MSESSKHKSDPSTKRRERAVRRRQSSRRQPVRESRLLAWWLETYATVDARSLAVFRVLLGIVLLHDVARRWPDIAHHYANSGWLTNHFAMFRPMSDHLFSLYLAFSTPAEVKVLLAVHLLVNFLLLIGWHTRLMQVLAFVLIVSLNSRNIMLENGGFVVLHLLVLWSAFLPLGRCYSVDALLRSLKARREGSVAALNAKREASHSVVSLAAFVLILQFVVIYYFNVVHKTGASWKDGTAVYYFFEQDRMVTAFGAWLRHQVSLDFVRLLTWSTLFIESLIALLLVSPAYTRYTRMLAWGLVIALHLSIDAVVQLGPFSYAMIIVHAVFIPREFWSWWSQKRLERGRLLVGVNPESAGQLACARLLVRLLPAGTLRFREVEGADSLEVSETSDGPKHNGLDAVLKLAEQSIPLRVAGWVVSLPWFKPMAERSLSRFIERYTEPVAVTQGSRVRQPGVAAVHFERGKQVVRDVVLLFFVISCASQVLTENRAIPASLKPERRPEWMTAAVVYPRLFQGWSMFAPGPPMDDGKIVVEGRTKDGRRFDPLSQGTPDYELNPAEGFRMNQLWGDFHRRIWQARFRAYWNGFRDYLRNHHEITGRPEDELVAFEVYYVSEMVPRPGAPRSAPRKERLFTFGSIDRVDRQPARRSQRP